MDGKQFLSRQGNTDHAPVWFLEWNQVRVKGGTSLPTDDKACAKLDRRIQETKLNRYTREQAGFGRGAKTPGSICQTAEFHGIIGGGFVPPTPEVRVFLNPAQDSDS